MTLGGTDLPTAQVCATRMIESIGFKTQRLERVISFLPNSFQRFSR